MTLEPQITDQITEQIDSMTEAQILEILGLYKEPALKSQDCSMFLQSLVLGRLIPLAAIY